MSLTLAIRVQAVELSSDRSQSFANLRHRPSQVVSRKWWKLEGGVISG